MPPNQDKEVFNRISPGAVPAQPEKLLPVAVTPKLPANGLPLPSSPPRSGGRRPSRRRRCSRLRPPVERERRRRSNEPKVPANPPNLQPATNTPAATESGPSIASLIENMSGPTGGWRIQVASVKSEDIAKSTWARLQSAHGEQLASLRMQAVRVDLGDRGVWYRVQAGPLDEKQAHSVCTSLKTRKADCVSVPPAR